jgi:hypothetical protein
LLAMMVLLAGMSAARAATQDVLTVAVFDFESKDEAVRDLGPKVSAMINVTLSTEPKLMAVERAELEKVLGEHELTLSGNVSTEKAVNAGQLVGAKVLVCGRVFKLDKDLVMLAKVIGTETSIVYGEMVTGGANASVTELSAALAKKIADTIARKADTLMAQVESREDRVKNIKKALGDRKLPVVSVKIGEQHFGQRVTDPAAETELGKLLQECGFKLTDSVSTNKADVEITGEAFSALGMRKGNLVSCKARVELKARKHNGELVLVDRQTSVAVDIAEQTAAKTALQNAAAELAERILPKLVD